MQNIFEIEQLPGVKFPWHTRMDIDLWRMLRQFVYKRDGGKCQYCGAEVELYKCHIHHVVELVANGGCGTNHPTNLKVVCVGCHKKEHPHMMTKLEAVE